MKEFLLASVVSLVLLTLASAQETSPRPGTRAKGLTVSEEGAYDGYNLLSPLGSKTVYLLDMQGEVVHTWETENMTSGGVYLLDDGHLLRLVLQETEHFRGPGVGGGRVQELDWDGNLVWEYVLSDEARLMHHDVEPLPNGNLFVIVWEKIGEEDAIAFGRHPDHVGGAGMWMDAVLELKKVGSDGAEVVWEWHSYDHLVQDHDPAMMGYGSVAEMPERIDFNADHRGRPAMTPEEKAEQEEIAREMAALGYGGEAEEEEDDGGVGGGHAPDWLHTNAVDYLPEHDLIVLSTPHLNELWVIDHSTTTEQAADSLGGRRGKGGDLLWRWGNPSVYGAGHDGDRALFYQHDPQWSLGDSGELKLLLFNNGGGRPDGDYSSIDELVLPFDADKGFVREAGQPFGPTKAAWSFSAKGSFHSPFISGCHRLPNGNTLVTSGVPGRVFEVTRDGRIVWEYWNPYAGDTIDMPYAPPPHALFRVTRLPTDHPGLAGRL